jgi:hypothetical protein
MLAFLGPLAAAALVGQIPARDVRGQVVDEKGKPVAGAQVVVSAPFAVLRAAVARLEKVPIHPNLEQNADLSRTYVAEILGLPDEQRWRKVWSGPTYLFELYERDFR